MLKRCRPWCRPRKSPSETTTRRRGSKAAALPTPPDARAFRSSATLSDRRRLVALLDIALEVRPAADRFMVVTMTYYADLSPCDYFPSRKSPLLPRKTPLLAVGWLENGRPVPTGEVSEQVFDQLRELLRDPWGLAFCGWHDCDLCVYRYGPSKLRKNPNTVGFKNVFVPGDAKVYVAPEMILHYIDQHGYAPPPEFQQAVLDCPTMRSIDYLRAISELGLAHLA
jgi:hypothetical protein